MHTEKRQHVAVLTEHLSAAPYRYRFAQLLNLLVRMLHQQGILYPQAFGQVLRFRNSLSLAFPASEIEDMQVDATDGAGTPRIHITPTFIGLLGASGTLPLHDTERAAARANLGADESWKPFVDLFSNRVIGLFYEAWGKYRVEHSLDTRGQDELLPLLSALGGLRPASFGPARSYASIPAGVAGYYAGLLRARISACLSVSRNSSAPGIRYRRRSAARWASPSPPSASAPPWAPAPGATTCESACISVHWMRRRQRLSCRMAGLTPR
jgi:type VI secretion system protein ImpH